jgi:hypothetical protein
LLPLLGGDDDTGAYGPGASTGTVGAANRFAGAGHRVLDLEA